ncbi:uncharacterized protein LOC134245562 [Saccostrea cucullata]|uniref:uncharacterized protein LOC134245562 n=1 Tax=Saccostrea cuccullata TaxID=36930 RepID=UPI002ED6349A
MQAQVLSAIVNRVNIKSTINYGQKYITDLKYVNNGRVCVSVVNSQENTLHCQFRGGSNSIQYFCNYGACLCYIHGRHYLGDYGIVIYSDNRSLLSYSIQPQLTGPVLPSQNEPLDGYIPNGIAVCKSGSLLVSLWNNQVHDRSLGKVLKLSYAGNKLSEIKTDKNRPLFICPSYIAENGNGDICVSDVNAVVVTDAGGFLRFRYTGAQSDPQFDPYGICCDSKNDIIVADMVKNRIHMIDENGELLHYIQYKDMHMPRALCIDEDDNLYVGEWLSEDIKVLSHQ